MIGDLFDSPWKILIVALVIIVLFGSKKLPSAARSLGQSMRILKREVQGLHEDEPEPGPPGAPATARAPAEITVGASDDRRAQIDALQRQIPDLERAAVMHAGPETPATAGTGASRPARQPI